MKTINLVIFSLLLVNCASLNKGAPAFFTSNEIQWGSKDKVFVFFRHAEKEKGNDPQLSTEGIARAQKLEEIFIKHKPRKIFSTDTKRTLGTVQAIADRWNRDVEIYDPKLIEESASFLKSQRPGIYLISGHSNTTPSFANEVCDCNMFPAIDESDYSNIFVVVINGESVTTHNLQY